MSPFYLYCLKWSCTLCHYLTSMVGHIFTFPDFIHFDGQIVFGHNIPSTFSVCSDTVLPTVKLALQSPCSFEKMSCFLHLNNINDYFSTRFLTNDKVNG